MTRKTTHRTRFTLVFGALASSLSTVALFGYSALAADLPAFSAEDVFEMEYANDPKGIARWVSCGLRQKFHGYHD